MCEVLSFDKVDSFEAGSEIIGRNSAFIVDPSFQMLTIFSKFEKRIVPISELGLLPSTDKINHIDYIQNDVLFIYATKRKMPIGFIYNLDIYNENYLLPQIVEFELSSLSFHRKILGAFVPFDEVFYVVSEEGVSCFNMHFLEIHYMRTTITSCCFYQNYLCFTDNLYINVYRIDHPKEMFRVNQKTIDNLGSPVKILGLSHCLLLFFPDKEKRAVIQKVIFETQKSVVSTSVSNYFPESKNFSDLSFSVYDNLLMTYDKSVKKCILIDMYESAEIIIGNSFSVDIPIISIINSNQLISNDSIYSIQPKYTMINSSDCNLIAALFRRSNSLSHAIALFTKLLKNSLTIVKMSNIIDSIAPSATSPYAQVRFVHAIQFSGIVDPHLILLALLRYSMILGDKMVDDAQICIIQSLAHPSCRHTMKDLISVWGMNLNEKMMKYLVTKLDETFWYSLAVSSDILLFAKVCIDEFKKEAARKMLIKYSLDGGESVLDFQETKQLFIKKFDEDPLIPS